jgi:hypothetical protein
VYDVGATGFSLRYEGTLERPPLTIRIDARGLFTTPGDIRVLLPDGSTLSQDAIVGEDLLVYRITVPAQSGRFRVIATTDRSH